MAHASVPTFLVFILSCRLALAAGGAVEIPASLDTSQVPGWDARGLGPLPRQAVACLDFSEDGRFVAVGTISPPGDLNLFVLDENGKVVQRLRAGLRWLSEVAVSPDGRFASAVCTTPEGTAGDSPRVFGFRQGEALAQVGGRFRFGDFRASAFLLHYGDHSNHVPGLTARAGPWLAVVGDDVLWWLAPDEDAAESVALGHGMTTALAVSPAGRAVVGRSLGAEQGAGEFASVVVLERGRPKPLWIRPASTDVASSPEPEKGVYGPPVPPYRDAKFQVPLSLAIDGTGERVAVADYEAWERRFRPLDGSAEFSYSRRVTPARPTVHVYDADGKPLRRVGPEAFRDPFWCDLALTGDGRRLLIWPHHWTSRGLGGQPILPADAGARDLYILDLATGDMGTVRFPDAIASVAGAGGGGIVVGCWDRRVYFLDETGRPIAALPKGLEVGAASLVRASRDGRRVAVVTTAGTVLMLDASGREIWCTDLHQAAKPGDASLAKNVQADKVALGLWRTNGNRAHSDLGNQTLVEAPQGLLLIDPNAGASFEQNWARIRAAGLDPMQVKYVLLTHEHGDHAPGAYLWRVITGAQVVASAETAYTLRHHIPIGTGYGLHPPQPVDIVLTEDRDLDLAGLKVRAIRLPGHTYGSMGYVFAAGGKTYVATGDLIMDEGLLGYSGSIDFSARNVLASLRKLEALRPDMVLGGHGRGRPDTFIAKGIEAGEATGWSRMTPEKPNPLYRFTQTNYLVAAWLQPVLAAACGDIDGDGRPDVAVLVPKGQGAAVRIYLNKGGRFAEAPDGEIDLPDLGRAWKLGLVRLGTGKTADLVASSEDRMVVLLAQAGPLRFRVVPVAGPVRAAQFLAGDFGGGGRAALVVGSRFVGSFGVASQEEDGTFRFRQAKPLARGYFDIALADVNGDKREDLLLSSGDIFLRQADGALAEAPSLHLDTPQGTDAGWTFMGTGDFDHDGWPDAAFIANAKDGALVRLYRNTRRPAEPFAKEPSAAFTVPGAAVLRGGPTVADWNGDGAADLVLGALDKRGARILAGSPQDGLSPSRATAVALDYEPFYDARLAVADFDGDGRPDLAGFGPSSVGAVGVYIWLRPPDKGR